MEIDEIRKKRSKKKKKFNRRKIIRISIFFGILIAIIIGIFLLINSMIPVKNVEDSNISIKLSTTKETGKSIIANLDSKTNHDIFYFIDYSAGEEDYYEEEIKDNKESLASNNTTNSTVTETPSNSVKNEISIKK